jgi:hypothetical protein
MHLQVPINYSLSDGLILFRPIEACNSCLEVSVAEVQCTTSAFRDELRQMLKVI